jgi:phosphatidylglycerophosphate synthase
VPARPGRDAVGVNGLYALKPWYAARLAGLRGTLVRRDVSPDTITLAGIGFGAAAGAVLWSARPGPVAALVVAALLAARLACANLDGGVARESGRADRFGPVVNELGDRLAELAALAGLAAAAPLGPVAAAGLAGTLPALVALAGAAAGAPRVQGGPVGKTERCALLVVAAATGWVTPVLVGYAAGSLLTAALRLGRVRAALAVVR